MTVREFGQVVLMGGVGMLGGDDLALPYPWIMRNSITIRGQWMCPREANVEFISLVRSGLLDLSQFEMTEFDLDHANDAVAHAAHGGPFRTTVIRPCAGSGLAPLVTRKLIVRRNVRLPVQFLCIWAARIEG